MEKFKIFISKYFKSRQKIIFYFTYIFESYYVGSLMCKASSEFGLSFSRRSHLNKRKFVEFLFALKLKKKNIFSKALTRFWSSSRKQARNIKQSKKQFPANIEKLKNI